MSLIINGRRIVTPGLDIVSWADDASLPKGTDFNRRTRKIRVIVWHTVHGKTGPLRPGIKHSNRDRVYAIYQARTPRKVSWHFTIDTDGSITQSLDPCREVAWHASYTETNEISVGIELVQDTDGSLYEGQIQASVAFSDVLHRELAAEGHFVPKQIPWHEGSPDSRKLARCLPPRHCADVYGNIGHRNNDPQKPFGDPGQYIFRALKTHGYEGFDLQLLEDRTAWRERQRELGMHESDCDGLPGPKTFQLMREQGKMWGQ